MNVCILGNGLTSLCLAKTLVNLGIYVDIFYDKKIQKPNNSRTIGLTRSNVEFFNKNILNPKKILWDIKEIEVFSENLKNNKILNFKNNNQRIFSILKNNELYNLIYINLIKSKFFKFKKNIRNKKKIYQEYNLIINCDFNSDITKKFFFKKITKNYESFAYTTIIKHNKVENNIATQTFTNSGPIAFLPISKKETSVVFSINKKEQIDIEKLIKKYNTKYLIKEIGEFSKFELKSSNIRNYYYKNILAFGDLLHKIHPLAGQGFNMTVRDIKVLLKIIKSRIENGLELDSSVCHEFEKNVKHKNFIFSNGIDLIHQFFNLERKDKTKTLSNIVQYLGKNKLTNQVFTKFADSGLLV
jgi:2-octaprenyl-6-methoxyphenol hydroxylase